MKIIRKILILFISFSLCGPNISIAGLHFGRISAIKKKIKELKEKVDAEKERIRHLESTTGSNGVVSFSLPNGNTASIKLIDQEISVPLTGIKVFLITDAVGSAGAYLIVDPDGEYASRIVNASETQETIQGIHAQTLGTLLINTYVKY